MGNNGVVCLRCGIFNLGIARVGIDFKRSYLLKQWDLVLLKYSMTLMFADVNLALLYFITSIPMFQTVFCQHLICSVKFNATDLLQFQVSKSIPVVYNCKFEYSFQIVIFAIAVGCMGAPAPGGLVAYSAPVVSPVQVVSPVVSHVVSPAVSTYSAHSSSIVHNAPVYTVPLASAPLVHSVPLTYSSPLVHPVFV